MIMIIIVHFSQNFELDGLFGLFCAYCQMGVQCFFMLSAYSLCKSYAATPRPYLSFLKHRISKILPTYWLMIVINIIIHFLLTTFQIQVAYNTSTDLLSILINVFLLNGLVPFANNNVVFGGWFIGTIVILYALFPIFYRFYEISKKQNLIPFSGAALSFFLCLVFFCVNYFILQNGGAAWRFGNNSFFYNSFINQLSAFLLGFNLYYLIDASSKEAMIASRNKNLLLSIGFLIISLFMFSTSQEFLFTVLPLTSALSWMYFYLFLEGRKEKDKSTILQKALAYNGKNSLYIYLIHSIFVWGFFDWLRTWLINGNLVMNDSIVLGLLIIPLYVLILAFAHCFKAVASQIKLKID